MMISVFSVLVVVVELPSISVFDCLKNCGLCSLVYSCTSFFFCLPLSLGLLPVQGAGLYLLTWMAFLRGDYV